jgi:hypothetical protein
MCDSLLVTTKVVPSTRSLFILKVEEIRSSETSVLTRPTQSHIPEDVFLHSDYYMFRILLWQRDCMNFHCSSFDIVFRTNGYSLIINKKNSVGDSSGLPYLFSLSVGKLRTRAKNIGNISLRYLYILHLCKIWGFHGGDYEEWCLLGCYAVWLL